MAVVTNNAKGEEVKAQPKKAAPKSEPKSDNKQGE